MDKLERIGATAILAGVFTWFEMIAVPFLLLILLQVIDYGTGLVAAKYRNETINSYKSFNGISKKICMWLLVIIGGALDWLVAYAAANVGLDLGVSVIVAVIVCAWLMCNEIISILENMIDIGVQMPAFLLKITKHIQSKVEDSAETDDDKEDDDV
ncbi:MAG: phage holin family protein [Oscillospiraceae bacterium]|nr:phage holin family protein [Oscillospiraceae bacterium]